MASSSITQTQTSDQQDDESNQTLGTDHESYLIVSTPASGHVKEKAVKRDYRPQASTLRDQSSKFSPRGAHKNFCQSFSSSSLRSNFLSNSHHRSGALVVHARPFDEFAVDPLNTDGQSAPTPKPGGSSSSWNDRKS